MCVISTKHKHKVSKYFSTHPESLQEVIIHCDVLITTAQQDVQPVLEADLITHRAKLVVG